MKITKYPQSCLVVQARGVRLLFDPGVLKYKDRFFDVWKTADAVFVTHKHADHCHFELIAELGTNIPLHTTAEVIKAYPLLDYAKPVREGAETAVGEVSVRAVRAVHGYHPLMRGNEVFENIGFLVDDGETSLYITGDTICFPTDLKTDIIAMPVTGHGVTMTAFEASLFARETGAKHILLTHMDNEAFEIDWQYINKHFGKAKLEYTILETEESVELV